MYIHCAVIFISHFYTLYSLQKKAIQKSNKDVEREGEEGSLLVYVHVFFVMTEYTYIPVELYVSHYCNGIQCLFFIPPEFMKTLLLMEATLKAENEVSNFSCTCVYIIFLIYMYMCLLCAL